MKANNYLLSRPSDFGRGSSQNSSISSPSPPPSSEMSSRLLSSPPFRPPPPNMAPPMAPPSPLPVLRKDSRNNGVVSLEENRRSLDFLDLMEKEETDFATQIKRQKEFLQNVFRDKEELAAICAQQTNKLAKYEHERLEWQRKIIEAEREKRDLVERKTLADNHLTHPHHSMTKKFEKLKGDYDKLLKDKSELTEILFVTRTENEKLREENKNNYVQIEKSNRDKVDVKVGELNLKLNLEMGTIKSENEQLRKINSKLKEENEKLCQKTQEAQVEILNLKANLQSKHQECQSLKTSKNNFKVNISKLKKEIGVLTDRSIKNQRDFTVIEEKYSVENQNLKSKLVTLENEQMIDITKYEDSLRENTNMRDSYEFQMNLSSQLKIENDKLIKESNEVRESLSSLQRRETEYMREKRDFENTLEEYKSKIAKIEEEKKARSKNEKNRKDTTIARLELEKKELEDKVSKLKLQFDKIAIESKRKMSRLEEDSLIKESSLQDLISSFKVKEDEIKSIQRKLEAREKELSKMKGQHKTTILQMEKEHEELEKKMSQVRRSSETYKRKNETFEKLLLSEKEAFEKALSESLELKNQYFEEKNAFEKKSKELEKLVSSHQNEIEKLNNKREERENNRIKDLIQEVFLKDEILQSKENEIKELRSKIVNTKEFLKGEKMIDKLNSEKDDLKNKMTKKDEMIKNAERDKRDLQIAKDKLSKTLEEIEDEKCRLKDALLRLENEKKFNNFGKYEKEKMKNESERQLSEKTRLLSQLENLSGERNIFQSKYESQLKENEVLKNSLLNSANYHSKERDGLKEQIKTLEEAQNRQIQKQKEEIERRLNEQKREDKENYEKEKSQRDAQSKKYEGLNSCLVEKVKDFERTQIDLIAKIKDLENSEVSHKERYESFGNKRSKTFESEIYRVLKDISPKKLQNQLRRILEAESMSHENYTQEYNKLKMSLSESEKEKGEQTLKIEKLNLLLAEKSHSIKESSSFQVEDFCVQTDIAFDSKKDTGEEPTKKSVKFAKMENEESKEVLKRRIESLEKALKEAQEEREEILEAAQKEIEYHRSIALECESTMIEDFEWKLHEIEGEYSRKLKEQSIKDSIVTQFESEFCRHNYDKVSELENIMTIDAEKKNGKLIQEVEKLQKDQMLSMEESKSQDIREGDEKALEEQIRASDVLENFDVEKKLLSEEYDEKIIQIVKGFERQIKSLENRLEVALGVKYEHMLSLREEVEEEYAERMEDLRSMYKEEIETQNDKFNSEKAKLLSLESSLQESLALKRSEIEEYKVTIQILSERIEELSHRLHNQTDEVLRLQSELEEMEYQDAIDGASRIERDS